MVMTDTIADLFTRIRNGLQSQLKTVNVPYSNQKVSILKILESEGFISGYEVENQDAVKKEVKVRLKYRSDGAPSISYIQRRSRPGNRVYVQKRNVPKILNGFGVSILSTNLGVISGKEARMKNVGGELIGVVY